ncbi:MAG: DUF4153 domain-containing protein [Hyphomicrobiales bacterium]|nr:DUF4153 domain-containing protein [Hyphomicrobiales bacterium]
MSDAEKTGSANFLYGVAETLVRFPGPVLLAACLTAFNLYWLVGWPAQPDPLVRPVNNALVMSIAFAIAAQLWAEASSERLAAFILQASGVLFFFWLWDVPALASMDPLARKVYAESEFASFAGALSFNAGLGLAALALLLGLAPYLRRQADSEAVWQFNHKLWVAFLAAGFGAIVLYVGVWGAIKAVETLFVVEVPRIYDERMFVVAACLAFPLIWLTLIPREFSEPAKTGRDMEFTSRAVALLVKFIFVPLTFVFAAILLVYSGKVLLTGGFNEARLGQIGVIYSACVVATALLAYPTRDAGWFMATFWRVWPYLLIAPVGLLIAALYIRFANYGVTPARYMSALAAVWFAALIALFALSRSRADIRLIPGLLAALLLAAAVGPWGATGLTVSSQSARLEALLAKNGLIDGGRVSAKASDGAWAEADQNRASSALRELHNWSGMERVRLWFEGDPQNPFSEPKYASLHANAAKRLGVPAFPIYRVTGPDAGRTFSFNFRNMGAVRAEGAKWVYGPRYVTLGADYNANLSYPAAIPALEVRRDGELVKIELGGRSARFNLPAALAAHSPVEPVSRELDQALIITPQDGELRARLYLVGANGVVEGEGADRRRVIRWMQFYVLLDE